MIPITSNILPTTPICTLIDSGCTHCFLDFSVTSKHQLHTYSINLIPLQLFNGTANFVIHNLPVHFTSGDEHYITFYATPLDSSYAAVLGHNWITHFNLLIDWVLVLDIDHWWISNKSILLCHPPPHLFHPKAHSISITSLTPLCSSLSPLPHPLSLCSLFHWYLFPCHYDPLISRI